MIYTIKVVGDPIHVYTDRECKTRAWTPYKEQYSKWVISIDSTFEGNPKLKHPVDVKVDIYCRLSFPPSRLSSYAKLVESLLEKKVCRSLDDIFTFEIHKHLVKYDPYTLVTITERENGKKY